MQTGKCGDLISLAPILKHEHETTGEKPMLLVAKEYSQVAERMPFVQSHVWDGDWQNLDGAVRYAKVRFDQVITPQIFGREFPVEHRTPSFQLDQWLRAGYLDKWDTLPTIIERPRNARSIVKSHLNGKPTILYADHSQSSPFTHKDALHRLLVDNFGASHDIKRLSEIRFPNPLDLLALFDAADCLVTVETMALHLSAASTIPTVALVADKPNRWKGSAWSKRFKLHVRYGDYEKRRPEIITAIRKALNKSPEPAVETFKTEHGFGYNPSIIRHGDKLLTTYRYHPDDKWKTKLAITDGEKTWTIQPPRGLEEHSLEDARLFHYRGRLHCAYTLSTSINNQFRCAYGYSPLSFEDGKWRLLYHYQPTRKGNDFSGLEKNWAPFVIGDTLYFLYKPGVALEVDDIRVIKEHKSPPAEWAWGEIRGDVVLPWKGKLLRIFHSRLGDGHRHYEFRYYVGAALMNSEPPFETIAVSKEPVLAGHEKWMQCRHWKMNVVFSCGAIADRDTVLVSVGINDCECATVMLREGDLNL